MIVLKEYKLTFLSSLVSVGLLACFLASVHLFDPIAKTERSIEEHKIISAVLDLDKGYVLIAETTIKFPERIQSKTKYLKTIFPKIKGNTSSCFEGFEPLQLKQSYIESNIRLYSDAWLQEVREHKDFRSILARNSYFGFTEVSKPCILANSSMAVLFTITHCGGLCGGANFYLLKKRGVHWKIINRYSAWMY